MSKRGGGGGRRKVGHKGGHKRFSNRDEILSQQDDIRRIKENEGEEDGGSDARKLDAKNESGDSSSSEDEKPVVGVGGLIEVENPNWIKKEHKKVTELDTSLEPSRREREALEKEKARLHYEKLHAAGKTEQAQADLARLAIIRREREEAAAKRQVEADAKKKEEDARKARETEKRQQLESKGGVPAGRKGKR